MEINLILLLAKNLKKEGIKKIFIDDESLKENIYQKIFMIQILELFILKAGDEITENMISFLNEKNINTIDILKYKFR